MSSPARRCLLAVFAHPDDETSAAAGTLIHYAREGVDIPANSAALSTATNSFQERSNATLALPQRSPPRSIGTQPVRGLASGKTIFC